jgi:PAS domain S-box-containing protein
MFPWKNKKKQEQIDRQESQMKKFQESQELLLQAASSTAELAHDVTIKLKERLDDSLKQLESTSNLLADALIVCSDSGRIESINPAAEHIFGWKSSDILGQTLDSLITKTGNTTLTPAKIIEELTNSSLDTMMKTPLESLRGKRKTGELFWIDGSISFLERTDGSILSMILIRDVSDAVQMQQELASNEVRYRSIFEQSFDGILVVQNYRIVAANPAIASVLGRTAESMIAKPLMNFFHKQIKTLLDNHTDHMNGAAAPKNCIVAGIKSDGKVVDLLVSSTLIQWEGSNASLITMKDVTEIKTLENDLNFAKLMNQALTDNNIDMFVTYDATGVIKSANKAYLERHHASEVHTVGTNIIDKLPEDQKAGYKEMLQTLNPKHSTGRVQLHFKHKDSVETQDWIIHAIFDEDNQFIEYQAFGRDMTDIVKNLQSK